MTLKVVSTDKAPKAIGPYSQAIRAGNFLFCSGQVPINPETGAIELFDGDAGKQAQLVMDNLKAVLSAEGFSFNDVVKTTIFLSSMYNFAKVNEIYASYFSDYKPARACVEVSKLPKGVDIEIEAIAYK